MNELSKRLTVIGGGIALMSALAVSLAFAQADTTPPSMPTSLSATAVSASQIDLSWTAATDTVGVTGYGIFRNGTQVATSTGTGTTYNDTGLAADTTFTYTVDAFDAAGNLSTRSSSASATTLTSAPPTVPGTPNATAVSSSQINLQWSGSSDSNGTLAGYKVYRDGTQVGTTTATSFSDTGLATGTTHTYTIAAYDTTGNTSSQSNSSGATTFGSSSSSSPSIPSGLNANAVSSSQINLSWNTSSDTNGATISGYHIYRNGVEINSTSAISYSDTGLSPSTSYTYTVASYDSNNNVSSQSGGVTTSTLGSGSTTTTTVNVPPTVDISSNGAVTIHDLTVTSVGTNTFTGTVWGITYTVNYNASSTNSGRGFEFLLRGGNGATWNSSQIQVGDQLGVQGTVTQSSPTTITAQVVRNYSITNSRPVNQNHNNGNGNGNGNTGNNGYGSGNGNSFGNSGQNIQGIQTLLQNLLGQFRNIQRQR